MNEAAERLEHVGHIGLHIDPDGVIRCFSRTHGGADPVVVDLDAALASERKATVERIRAAAIDANASEDALIGWLHAILDAEAER